MNPDEQQDKNQELLIALGLQVARLETMREFSDKSIAQLVLEIRELTLAIAALSKDLIELKTQRNTLVAISGILGGFLSWVAGRVFVFMTGGKR